MRTPRIVAIDEKKERTLDAVKHNFVDGYMTAGCAAISPI
jgi:hypothetical protein